MADETQVAAPAADASAQADTSQETNTSAEAGTGEAQAAAPAAETKAVQKMLKKLRIKVDGEEFDEDLPFEIPDTPEAIEYAKRQAQLARVSQKRMQDFSTLQKEVVEFIDQFRKNPKSVLQDPRFGIDVKNLAAQIIEEEIENSKKTPEQRELEKTRAEIKALKDQQEREKQEALTREKERLTEEQFERYDIELTQALEKSDLPKSPYVVKKFADYMLVALENNKDITPAELEPLVREEVISDLKAMFDVMPEDVVEGIIGKKKFDSIRKKNIVKAKEKASVLGSPKAQDVGKKGTDKKDATPKKTFKDYFGV